MRQLSVLKVFILLTVVILSAKMRGVMTAPQKTAPTFRYTLFKDCTEILANGLSSSGVYVVQPLDNSWPIAVYCDMDTDGGGWTVFQRRKDGTVDFYRDFGSYSRGFGDPVGEFWLGNDNLHRLTSQDEYELRVDLSDFQNQEKYAVYNSFSVSNVSDNYALTVGGYSGTAGNSLSYHNNKPFTTKDRDNDDLADINAAQEYQGAWWYKTGHRANLNGLYLEGQTTSENFAQGINWYYWKGWNYSLKTSEMKIRAKP